MRKFNWVTKACGVFLLWMMAAIALPAQTFTTLHSFNASTDGSFPKAALIQATDGNLYGTTYGGAPGYGVIFKITPSGTLTTLNSLDKTDGEGPIAGLVQAANGDFYGTADHGGTSTSCPTFDVAGCGTIFRITAGGTVTALDSFDYTDGANPFAGLVQGTDGFLYGTTEQGGANSQSCKDDTPAGCGTVFKITPSGTLTTLHNFDVTDGFLVDAGLVESADGDFYGTTVWGGPLVNANCRKGLGCGTVFKITPSGTLTTIHNFCSETICADGEEPVVGLVQGTDGNLYGTTSVGGANDFGTIFKITPSGTLTAIYSFCSQTNCADGFAASGLIQGTDGNFYGTTNEGGANEIECDRGCGTVFKITPGGTLTTLYSFCSLSGCADGQGPEAGLAQDTNGTFYGTASAGGVYGDGVVFSLSVGLGPFVETQPTSGPVGGTVKILGTGLTGATSVTFNGTPAVFTVDSHSLIITTVPTGATSGKVQVTVPSGTLSSNVPFTVN
jgi:uncharacterized repeat protein (TIGR03803 family)